MNILHIIMLKLLKGATAGIAVVAECNHDFYAFMASIPTDTLSAITETVDTLSAMVENTDVRAIISLDTTDALSAMIENTDTAGEIC